jgi:hypothetical protein
MRSGFERTLATQLRAAGIEFEYESMSIPYTRYHSYHPDFILANGIIIEAKGYFRSPAEMAKMKSVKEQHPELDIRFVFWDANKKCPGLKSNHGQWATRTGFPWAEGRIPEEWLQPT